MAMGATAGVLFVYNSDLPQVESLEDKPPSLMTEVYSDDGSGNQVIGSFALERRIMLKWEEIPPVVRNAVIAVEDQNFETHWGIDMFGIARAGFRNLMKGRAAEGGSTLTQQLSKNLFLTPEKRLRRKIQEAMLSIQIERNYTKPQILTMYCNLIYMGHGQYGFAAAADFYFGKKLKDLTIEEAALLAALPRSPNNYSPIYNPSRAKGRRDYAIDRMVAEKKITATEGDAAKKVPINLPQKERVDELAPYFVEDLRQYLEKTYGPWGFLESGLKVYSTLNVEMQKAANVAVRQGLRDYDKRHGWRGPLRNVLTDGAAAPIADNGKGKTLGIDLHTVTLPDWKFPVRTNDIVEGLILAASKTSATVKIASYEATLNLQDMAWTKAKAPDEILKPGDVALFMIRSLNAAERKIGIALEQRPNVQGALVAIDPSTGDIKALVGGYDFATSKFNRATQALRQTGSIFKPFVYTAAIDRGVIELEDTIVDSPVRFGGYSPGNYDGKYEGTITIRRALGDSRNIPAVKVLNSLGVDNLIPYIRRFGLTSKMDPYLPLALGAADVSVMEMVSAYTTFPNDGVRVVPRSILRVTDYEGDVKKENFNELRDVIPAETARAMVELLQEPVKHGTSVRAQELKRPVGGKTGTTNDFTDAWFIGFTPSLVMGVWVGFDEKVTLGDKETGGRAALPIWLSAMQEIYKDRKVETFQTNAPPAVSQDLSAAQAALRGGQQ